MTHKGKYGIGGVFFLGVLKEKIDEKIPGSIAFISHTYTRYARTSEQHIYVTLQDGTKTRRISLAAKK